MVLQKKRSVAAALVAAAMLLAVPAQSSACGLLDCLFGWCGGSQTTYRVPYATTAYSPVAYTPCATQTCRYVPQTSYRTVCRRVPVTTCQAVTCSDPCTGCPVTTYRPITTWTTQSQLVPYTTYRLVYSYPSCAPCGSSSGVPSSAASCCTPSLSTPAQIPTDATETFQKAESPAGEQKMKPDPDPTSDTNTSDTNASDTNASGPSLFLDRTTS